MSMKHLAAGLSCIFLISTSIVMAQDRADYDPAASAYRAPALSLAGTPDSSEMLAALGPLWRGDTAAGLAKLKELSTLGNVAADIFLGDMYRQENKLKIDVDPEQARHFFELASAKGSGEASEQIAEMLEHHEIPANGSMSAAEWRALAVQQGWIQQQLATFCITWVHGPEPLHCDFDAPPPETNPLLANGCPSTVEMDLLHAAGFTGKLTFPGGGALISDGPTARAVLIMDRPVNHEQDLKEPYGTSVIYIQTAGDIWRMVPPDAPLLDRYIVLKPDTGGRGLTGLLAQNPDGSSSGEACGPEPVRHKTAASAR